MDIEIYKVPKEHWSHSSFFDPFYMEENSTLRHCEDDKGWYRYYDSKGSNERYAKFGPDRIKEWIKEGVINE